MREVEHELRPNVPPRFGLEAVDINLRFVWGLDHDNVNVMQCAAHLNVVAVFSLRAVLEHVPA